MSATRHTGGLAAPIGRVVLVASLGGLKALTTVLAGLPAEFAVPITVAQHRRPTKNNDDMLATLLAYQIGLPVGVAENGASAHQRGVTVVPAGTTATIDADKTWSLTQTRCNIDVGDVLLNSSAAEVATLAVILTGRMADGTVGCRAVKRNNGRVLVQDPSTAQASGMPAHVVASGRADFVLPLDRLASAVLALTTAPEAAELPTVATPHRQRFNA